MSYELVLSMLNAAEIAPRWQHLYIDNQVGIWNGFSAYKIKDVYVFTVLVGNGLRTIRLEKIKLENVFCEDVPGLQWVEVALVNVQELKNIYRSMYALATESSREKKEGQYSNIK